MGVPADGLDDRLWASDLEEAAIHADVVAVLRLGLPALVAEDEAVVVELPALERADGAEHEELDLARDRAEVHRGVRRRAEDVECAVARPLGLD
eukprot:3646815-Prymnesium_polylepis.1